MRLIGCVSRWLLRCGMVLVIAALALAPAIPARPRQTESAVTEPEYINSFFLAEPNGALRPLERQTVGVAGKGRVFGFGSTGVSYEIQNAQSPVRIEAGAPIGIVVKLEKHDVDPANLVLLYSLKSAKGKRQLLISGVGFMSTRTKSDLQNKQLQMTFEKYGRDSLKITPASPLGPGEYAIAVQSHDQQPIAYCFGIDPSTK